MFTHRHAEYRRYFGVKILSEVAQLNLSNKKSGKSNKGFYIALGVCLIAVGAAAWTTYDSVTKYTTPQASSQSEAKKTNNTVSGIFVTESSKPASSAPVPSSASSSTVHPRNRHLRPLSKPAAKPTAAGAETFSLPGKRESRAGVQQTAGLLQNARRLPGTPRRRPERQNGRNREVGGRRRGGEGLERRHQRQHRRH